MKKKYGSILLFLTILTCCNNPGGRSWIIPVTIDPSDLDYTPAQLEGFESRRNQVMELLTDGCVLLRSSDQSSRNRHEFRPNNYFYYLTGFSAPRSFALLIPDAENPFTLSLPPESIHTLIYEGSTMDADQINELYRPDKLVTFYEFRSLLDSVLETGMTIYMDLSDREWYEALKRKAGEEKSYQIKSVRNIVDELRVIKEPGEVERLQKACNITAKALINVMKECEPEMYEFEMESVIEGTFLQYGSAMPGFNSIVGSGPNSTILHYEPNTRQMENGDLLLMDIGAEYGYYTADITRTIPVNGKFSKEQKTIYQLVLDAQKAAIDSLVPGNRIGDGHRVARDILIRGLANLGLITDTASSWQTKFYILYPSSHWLGLDVHDVGDYGGFFGNTRKEAIGVDVESRELEPGMVLTIEPGIYFREKGLEQLYEVAGRQADSTEIALFIEEVSPVYEQYKNIGVRIEDDILITQEGNINLSRYAPKEVDDIEQLMR